MNIKRPSLCGATPRNPRGTNEQQINLSWLIWLAVYALFSVIWTFFTLDFYDVPGYRIGGAILLVALINLCHQQISRAQIYALLMGVLAANYLAEHFLLGMLPVLAVINSVSVIMVGWFGFRLMKHFAPDAMLPNTLSKTLHFIFYAITLPVMLASTAQASFESLILEKSEFIRSFVYWFSLRFNAMVLFSPLLLLFLHKSKSAVTSQKIKPLFILVLLTTLAVVSIVFLRQNPPGRSLATYSYLLIPLTLFAALRLPLLQTLLLILLSSLVAFWADSQTAGEGKQAQNSLVALSIFLSINTLIAWLVGTLRRDRDELLKTETQLRHLYEMISRINQLIIRRPLTNKALFSSACKVILEETGFFQVSLCFNHPSDKSVAPDQVTFIKRGENIAEHETGDSVNCQLMQNAVASGRSTLFQHCTQCSSFQTCDCKPSAQSAGAAFPIKEGELVVGGLLIFSNEPYVFTDGDIKLFQELADDLGFAINMQKMQRHLNQVSEVFEYANEAIIIANNDGTILDVNPAFTNITGYSRDDMIGQNPRILKSGQQAEGFFEQLFKQLLSRGVWSGEFWNQKKNGDLYLQRGTMSCVLDKAGNTQHIISVMEDITAQQQNINDLHQLANFDQLTGLPNRLLFKERFVQAVSQISKSNCSWSILFIDLDKFKEVNEAFGHQFGDNLLRQVTQRFTSLIRDTDIICRFGGDEFMVLTQGNAEVASHMAQRLIDTVKNEFTIESVDFHVGSSIGIALFPQDGKDLDTLIQTAETAMYKAKALGGNRAVFFNQSMQAEVQSQLSLRTELDKAIINNEFSLRFQPKVTVKDELIQIVSYEALIRWEHPEKGMIPPAIFIPLAERTGQIVEIDQWVIKTTLEKLTSWYQQLPDQVLPVAINVSAALFSSPEFVTSFQQQLIASTIPPHLIELEITEHVAILDNEYTLNTLVSLKKLGICLSMDDFGTGYSNLSYLHQYPVDVLKIDIAFVKDVHLHQNKQSLVKAIINMAHALDLITIAEGVECKEEFEFLKNEGCDQYQGYLFGKPELEEHLSFWISEKKGTSYLE